MIRLHLLLQIQIGSNLTFPIGRLWFQNESQISPLRSVRTSAQFGPMTILIFVVLSSVTILTLIFTVVILTRRRLYHGSENFGKESKPPQYYQSIWCELGKNQQINRKDLTIQDKIGQGCFGDVYRG